GEFMGSFNPRISGFWTARMGNSFVGSIAIDGETFHTDGARLRWFIVQPDHSGKNLGKQLLAAAMEFCSSAGHNKVFLWTFRGLQCARSLYERIGFRLVEEREVAQWGGIIFEQKFELITGNMNLEVLIDNTV
ncbi:MAG: GNAT family N-acetyltransferase, partial [Desulfomonilaceae bacterium]